MSESKDRPGEQPGKTFDEASDSPSEGSSESSEREPQARSEDGRAERTRNAGDATQDEMDRIMRAKPVAPPLDDDDEVPPSASASAMTYSKLDLPERRPDESLMDALMAVESSDDHQVVDPDDSEDSDELPPPIVLHPRRQAEPGPEPVPKPKPIEERRSPPKRTKSRLPLFVGGTVAAGLAIWLGRTPPERTPPTPAEGAEDAARPAESEPPAPGAATSSERSPEPAVKPDVPERLPTPQPERTPPQADPNRDPRQPPEGTPPEIAEVFEKIPVSPADRAPVGGVGATGIHIDHVSMGRGYEQNRCTGGDGAFSVSNDDIANVCLRVVHQREKEELSIVWQKLEGNARRGKILVKPLHAYRTRAYLKLRSEYVGDWDVTIYSDDGVELARYPFTIVP